MGYNACLSGLAFLLSLEEITSSSVSVQGMAWVFLLRYDIEGTEIGTPINRFPEDYEGYNGGQSYANRMWRATVLLQLELRRAMNTAKVSTRIFGHVRKSLNMNREEWDFCEELREHEQHK